MFSLARNIPEADSSLKNGKWENRALSGSELNGKILGVIGFGRIGYALAEKAKALGMNVLAYDYAFELIKPKATEIGVKVVDLDLLYAESDYISIHVPLLPNTLHMIDREAFTKMKTGVKIINTARGGVIDELALRWALDTRKVAGAALDVFEEEPSPGHELVTCSNIICTPHIGAGSEEAQTGNSVIVAEKLIGFFNS
jgi:D-3-phosphoglycerate dehydrogenase